MESLSNEAFTLEVDDLSVNNDSETPGVELDDLSVNNKTPGEELTSRTTCIEPNFLRFSCTHIQ